MTLISVVLVKPNPDFLRVLLHDCAISRWMLLLPAV